MSIEILREQIFNFLSTETPEVMAIKGAWGVGKTYSWKKMLQEASLNNNIKLDRYAYVSLFGIGSLEAFKYTIFENVIKKEMIGTEASIETFKKNASSLIESFGRQSINFFRSAPVIKDFNPAIESISFLSLNNTLICIDDLERKGKNLDIKDILGLISLLKEQKKCKIVVLLNADEDGLEDYSKYCEKVIDIELQFSPSPEDCASIAYPDDHTPYPLLKELVIRLGIKNIRILKKIERLVNLVLNYIENYEIEVIDQILHSIVVFSWSYYCSNSDKDIPPLDYIMNRNDSLLGIGLEEDNQNTQKQKWNSILQAYNYQMTDELDLVIAEAVKTGFFVKESLKAKALKKNKEVIAAKSQESFSKAWHRYHDSFDNNQKEVLDGLFDSVKRNFKYISPANLSSTVTLFRELGESERASEIIDFYIDQRKDELELFNVSGSYDFDEIKDSELVEKFTALYDSKVTIESPKEVLKRISHLDGWNEKDEVVLASTTENGYYELFKSESGRHLSSFVSTCLKFGQFSNSSDRQKEIAAKAAGALKRIGLESEINRRRVKKFGINVCN